MSLFAISDLYENERPVSRGGWHTWDTRETSLPGPTYAGIIERLELISIPLVATPQGAICDAK